jgi:replicative DNA helicase
MTTGLHGGELIILAARPAMGKTAFAMDVSLHVARSAPVALFSLEMSRESLLARAMCSTARVCLHRFRGGYLDQDERRRLAQAWEFCKTLKLVIDDKATTTMMEIAAKCRKVKHDHGLSLVVIDYMQLIGSKGKVENRVQEISAFSRSLKLLAKDLDVPVICLSQLNRSCETRPGDRRPLLSDLRDSGSIEQDADLVAFLFREEVYKPDREDLHGIAELIVAKQRNGPTGKIRLTFLNKFTKFDNLADIGETSGPVEEEPAPNEPEQRTWYH